MRLVRYEHDGQTRVGVREGNTIIPTEHTDMLALIRAGRGAIQPLRDQALPLVSCRLLAPIAAPGKLLFSGLNYRSHTEENPNAVLPTYPQCFAKLPSAVIGPD